MREHESHRWLTDDGAANEKRLEHLRERAGLASRVSVLRTFVLAWRVGSGKTTIRTEHAVRAVLSLAPDGQRKSEWAGIDAGDIVLQVENGKARSLR